MKKVLRFLPLFLIILLASFLRLYKLDNLPSGVNSDEVAIAYDAYSLLKTAKDQWGEFLPLSFFKSFGDYKLPLHYYLTIPSVLIFDLNEFSARFPSAVLGIFTVFLTFHLTKELFKKEPFVYHVSLMTAFIMAISPWHMVLSRTGHEITTSVFFIILGMWLFLKKQPLFFLSFFLGFYTYHTSRVFILLILPLMLFLYWREFGKKRARVYFALYLFLILLPFLVTFFSSSGQARIVQTTGVLKIGMLNQINEQRGLCLRFLPETLCRLAYNRLEFFGANYFKNYFNYFSPYILFTHGIQGTDTFSLPYRGLLYLFELPFVLLGLIFFFKNRNPHKKLLATWILLYPLPGSLISFDNSRRMTLIIPVFQIASGLGMVVAWRFIKGKLKLKILRAGFLMALSFLFAFSFYRFILDALEHNIVWSRDFKNGIKETIGFVKENEHKYDEIHIADYYDPIYIHYLFFTKYEPIKFQDKSNIDREMLKEEFIGNWLRVYRIGKVHFFRAFDWKKIPPNSLFIVEPGREGDLIYTKTRDIRRIVKKIDNLNNEPVFTIIEVER